MKKRVLKSYCAKRLKELEDLANQFWPGKDEEARRIRARNIWGQLNRETDWNLVRSAEPERDPLLATSEEILDICLWELVPSVGAEAIGYGDHLRRELSRYGFSLEMLFTAQKIGFEKIPWDDLAEGVEEQEFRAGEDLQVVAERHLRSVLRETITGSR